MFGMPYTAFMYMHVGGEIAFQSPGLIVLGEDRLAIEDASACNGSL